MDQDRKNMDSEHMQIRFRWTNGDDPAFQVFYLKTEEYYNALVGGVENRTAFIPFNISESIPDALIAYDGETAIGCAGLKQYSDKDIEVKRVWVEPSYRKHHIAQEMMLRLEQKAKENGFERMILQTRAIMTSAVHLYIQLGYQSIPNYPPYDKLEGAICFAKDLD